MTSLSSTCGTTHSFQPFFSGERRLVCVSEQRLCVHIPQTPSLSMSTFFPCCVVFAINLFRLSLYPLPGHPDFCLGDPTPTVYNPQTHACCQGHVSELRASPNQVRGTNDNKKNLLRKKGPKIVFCLLGFLLKDNYTIITSFIIIIIIFFYQVFGTELDRRFSREMGIEFPAKMHLGISFLFFQQPFS